MAFEFFSFVPDEFAKFYSNDLAQETRLSFQENQDFLEKFHEKFHRDLGWSHPLGQGEPVF